MVGKDVPWTSRFGRGFSNFWIFCSGGPWVSDSQSGFRIYPIPESLQLGARADRFQFEVEILARAESGDAGAEAAFQRYEDRLARGLAHVINLLDPDAIVLGGGLSNCDRLYEEVPKRWGRYVFSDRVDTLLLPPRHGDSSGVRGAAWLWG